MDYNKMIANLTKIEINITDIFFVICLKQHCQKHFDDFIKFNHQHAVIYEFVPVDLKSTEKATYGFEHVIALKPIPTVCCWCTAEHP